MNSGSPILYTVLADLVWIRIDGKGSFENSAQLRAFTQSELRHGRRQFVLDLETCSGMDSTFMGTLLAISRDVRGSRDADAVFDLVNANQRNVQLLKNLGLDMMLSVDEEGQRWPEERRQVGTCLQEAEVGADMDQSSKASVMLEAHEELARAKPENRERFRDVIHYLKHDLQAKKA